MFGRDGILHTLRWFKINRPEKLINELMIRLTEARIVDFTYVSKKNKLNK